MLWMSGYPKKFQMELDSESGFLKNHWFEEVCFS